MWYGVYKCVMCLLVIDKELSIPPELCPPITAIGQESEITLFTLIREGTTVSGGQQLHCLSTCPPQRHVTKSLLAQILQLENGELINTLYYQLQMELKGYKHGMYIDNGVYKTVESNDAGTMVYSSMEMEEFMSKVLKLIPLDETLSSMQHMYISFLNDMDSNVIAHTNNLRVAVQQQPAVIGDYIRAMLSYVNDKING